jgi:hypothetical protein
MVQVVKLNRLNIIIKQKQPHQLNGDKNSYAATFLA